MGIFDWLTGKRGGTAVPVGEPEEAAHEELATEAREEQTRGVPNFDEQLQKLHERYLKPGDVVIDVGAHTGVHTAQFARLVGEKGLVWAFEPLPVCREPFKQRMEELSEALQRVVRHWPIALSDFEGESEFVVAVDAPGYSGLRERTYDVPTRKMKIKVEVRTLDSIAEKLNALAYIKVDAEGGELGIVRGAVESLRRFRPVVTFEFGASSIWAYDITCADMAAFWEKQGYRIYDVLGRDVSDREVFVKSATEQSVWDYIAIPKEREKEVAGMLKG